MATPDTTAHKAWLDVERTRHHEWTPPER